jgi:hypothetical protein
VSWAASACRAWARLRIAVLHVEEADRCSLDDLGKLVQAPRTARARASCSDTTVLPDTLLVQPSEEVVESLAHLRVARPFHLLPVACATRDDVEMEVEHILLSFRPRATYDLQMLDPQATAVKVYDVLQCRHHPDQVRLWNLEYVSRVPLRNDEGVVLADRVDIQEGVSGVGLVNSP